MNKFAYELGQKCAETVGPYDADLMAKMVGEDAQIAANELNRDQNFGHYLFNPYVGGPMGEVVNRLQRRATASYGEHPYTYNVADALAGVAGGGLNAVAPGLGIPVALSPRILATILGGDEKQQALRDKAQKVIPQLQKKYKP